MSEAADEIELLDAIGGGTVETRSALVLTETEWALIGRIARCYLDSGNDWAERDEDDEALEIRSARALARELRKAAEG